MAAPNFELAKLVVSMVSSKSELEEAVEKMHKKLKDVQDTGKKKIIEEKELKKVADATKELGNSMTELVGKLLRTVGVEGELTEGLGTLTTAMGGITVATLAVAAAVVVAVAAIAALVEIVVEGTKKFIEWSDALIKARSLLHAFGGGSDAEIAHMQEWMIKLNHETGLAREKLQELYVEARRVTTESANPEANAQAIVKRAIGIAAVTKRDVESVARELAYVFEIGHDPRARLETLQMEMRRLGREFGIHRREILSTGDAWKLIDEVAQKGLKAQREQMQSFTSQWAQLKSRIEEVWELFSKAFGPIVLGAILGLVDALADIAEMLKIVAESFGIENWEEARDLWREITYTVVKPMVEGFRTLLMIVLTIKTAIDFMLYASMRLASVLSSIARQPELAQTWRDAAEDFYNTMLERDTSAMKRLAEGVIAKGGLGKTEDGGLGKISDIGRVGRPPEFSGLAEFWKKMQQQIVTGIPFDPARAHKENMAEQQKQTGHLMQIRDALTVKKPVGPSVAA
jgi:hypothetical protein